MPRIARVVVPGCPHHITQRGVRRMNVFFTDDDRAAYLNLLARHGEEYGIRFLAWCLMSNYVHLIAVPQEESSLAKGIGEAHKRYTRRINFREGSRGYLFQGRFFSCPLDDEYVLAALRYGLRNPVQAGIAQHAWEYQWSSARWLVGLADSDPLVRNSSLFEEIDDWRSFLRADPTELDLLRKHTRTGRPLGRDGFVQEVESITGRFLHRRKPGRKRRK